jgi:hypothetical protein
VHEPTFCTLVCRYFFFGWLFKDVRAGDVFERAAAVRYNREQARWLPVYMLRWLWWGLSFSALAMAAEVLLQATATSSLLYAIGALSVSFNVAILAAWVGLKGLTWPA